WGLLIAHQCFEPREWQDKEKNFLTYIAEHLAIAIYQAQLYAEVQQQKQTLEQRVIDRTQELHDAMLLAQSANRAKTEFLATMSHELRTPLTCVIGLSSTLLRWSFGQLSQKQRDYLQTIHDNGEHLLELINDILELSQLEAGKTVLNISEFSLSQIAHQEMANLKQKANQREVELAVAIRLDSQQDRFLADVRKVRQILYNLLSNGIKFTPQGGRVILRVWREGNRAVLQVEDTGIGIAEHQRHLLFQKFQQLDSSYHRQYEGTGLGLALTKQLVELHSGKIEVNSTVDVGSIFTVWLPEQQYPITTQKPESQPKLAYAKEGTSINLNFPAGRIVVIENNEETATLICEILTASGFQVVWLLEASTAMKQIEILQPLMVILDLQLSGTNGKEIVERIRSLPEMQNLKILALTNK
ncbi:MAG TPA: ATP-binding protein, partial [Phormidium sp.]